jgi:hypothetical protein
MSAILKKKINACVTSLKNTACSSNSPWIHAYDRLVSIHAMQVLLNYRT